jgi:hypothetical protein
MMLDAVLRAIENPNAANKARFNRTVITVGILASLGIAVIDKLRYLLTADDDDDEKLLDAVDLSKRTLLNTLSNFYGIGQIASAIDANYNNKPYGKTVQIPVLDNFMGSAAAISSLMKGDFRKAADKTIKTGFALGGIPLSPYTNFGLDDLVKGEELSDFQKTLKGKIGDKKFNMYKEMMAYEKKLKEINKESKSPLKKKRDEKEKLNRINKRLKSFSRKKTNPILMKKVNR